MNSVLVVYGTKTGCTQDIAEHIGTVFADLGVRADIRSVSDKPEPSAYDAVIVGSGVRAGAWHRAVRGWVAANAEALQTRPTAFYTVCMTMGVAPDKADEVRGYTAPLIEETGVQPVDLGMFAGMNVPRKFSLPERLILRAMKVPEGDYRDMDAVSDWTRAVVGDLGLAQG